jgi:hypothetical protein
MMSDGHTQQHDHSFVIVTSKEVNALTPILEDLSRDIFPAKSPYLFPPYLLPKQLLPPARASRAHPQSSRPSTSTRTRPTPPRRHATHNHQSSIINHDGHHES